MQNESTYQEVSKWAAEKREKLSALLQQLDVNSMQDINDLFKDMIGAFLENSLEGELDDHLGYTKYDYRNKTTDKVGGCGQKAGQSV